MGCSCGSEGPAALIRTIDSAMLEDDPCELTVYEVRRLPCDVYSVTFQTQEPVRIGSVVQFQQTLAHVVNASSDRAKVFLRCDEGLQILVNQSYSVRLAPVAFPAPSAPCVIAANFLAAPLALYLGFRASGGFQLLVYCRCAEDVIYREQLLEARAEIVCLGEGSQGSVVESTLGRAVSSVEGPLFAIGPVDLLKQALAVAIKRQRAVHGLLHLCGRAPKCDHRWLNLREDSLSQYESEHAD